MAPGRMKPSGIGTAFSSSAVNSSRRSTLAAVVAAERTPWNRGWWQAPLLAHRAPAAALHRSRARARVQRAPWPGRSRLRLRRRCRTPRSADRPCGPARRREVPSTHRRRRPQARASASCGREKMIPFSARPSLEDAAQVIKLLGHAPCLLDDFRQGHDLDVPVAAYRDDPAGAFGDELGGPNAKTGRPDPIGRGG